MKDVKQYWRTNIRYLIILLTIWFISSFGMGILLKEQLGTTGFWFAHQGSIYVFVLLIFVYVALMNRLDKKYGVDEE